MTQQTVSPSRIAIRCLALILGSAALAWLLFVAGQYVRLVEVSGPSQYDLQPERVTLAQYFYVAAVVVLGLGALFAKRRLAGLGAVSADRSTLVGPVSSFSGLVLIVASAIAVWAVLVLFLGGFFGVTEGGDPAPVARIVNLYVPIVLYTALVVTLILLGFVFPPPRAKHAPSADSGTTAAPAATPAAAPAESIPPTGAHAAGTVAADAQAATDAQHGDGQRAVALAFATPIIAAAVALVLGLIVYDVTRTALEVWIWVVILVIIAFGVLVGTRLARRGADERGAQAPIVAGATTLNFVLVIVFAIAAAGMSLGYAASAVSSLNVSPGLGLSAYADQEKYSESEGDDSVELVNPRISLWGSDLKRGTDATVTLDPGAETIATADAGRNRWVNAEADLPEGLAPGDYRLVAEAVTVDGRSVEVSLRMTVDAGGAVVFPDGSSIDETEESRLLPITAGWVFDDLLPAGVMLALALAVIAVSLQTRNRRQAPELHRPTTGRVEA